MNSMKRALGVIIVLLLYIKSEAQLKVSADRHYLITTSGKPFFWLGDTAWELFHRLTREEADLYLQDRADLKM